MNRKIEDDILYLKQLDPRGFEDYDPNEYVRPIIAPEDKDHYNEVAMSKIYNADTFNQLKNESVKLLEKIDELKEENEFLKAKLQIVQNDLDKCAEQRDEYKHQLNATNKEIEALKSKLRDTQDEMCYKFSYDDMNKLQSKLDDANKMIEALKSDKEYWKEQYFELDPNNLKKEIEHLKNRVNEIDSDENRKLSDQLFDLKNDYAVMKHRKDKEIQELNDRLSFGTNPWKERVLDLLDCCHILKEEHLDDPVKAINALCAWESDTGAYFERENRLDRKLKRYWDSFYSWFWNTVHYGFNKYPF